MQRPQDSGQRGRLGGPEGTDVCRRTGIHSTTLQGQGNSAEGTPMPTGRGTVMGSHDAIIGSHFCSFKINSTATSRRGIRTA